MMWRAAAVAVFATAAIAGTIAIQYPLPSTVFPRDISAPTFIWRDTGEPATSWKVEIALPGRRSLVATPSGERLTVGPLDADCVGAIPPELPPELAGSRQWKPDPALWRAILNEPRPSGSGTITREVSITITGLRGGQVVSRGSVQFVISEDPVAAPIFYRDVPLIPSPAEKGVIQPLPKSAIRLIQWRIRDVSQPESRTVMQDVPTCANCHSFSADGRTLGIDVDGPQNDKGLYALASVAKSTVIRRQDVIRWSATRDRTLPAPPAAAKRFGFMSQVSPDGEYVVTTIEPRQIRSTNEFAGMARGLADRFFNAGYTDYRFGQVFYPTRGILAWYSRETGKLQSLPGADDPAFVQTGAFWSPDGKYLIFSRAAARDPYTLGQKTAEYANDPNETRIQYDLYRIPFNNGAGGRAEPVQGASQNGKSNNFPKVSPDGRWIVYVQCKNGLLMRPDSELYIVPFAGGKARRLRANTKLMNSWHSFSPNGRWLVFSSKARSGYTEMFLTHIDENGNDTPPVLVENATAANRAVNIPEFVNIPPDGIAKIDPEATGFYRLFDEATRLAESGKFDDAAATWERALALSPDDEKAHSNYGIALAALGRPADAMSHYREAVRLGPDYPDPYTNMGILLAQSGRLDDAIAALRKALQLSPWDPKAYSNLGTALASAGRLPEALDLCERAVRLKPDDPEANANLAIVLARLGRRREAIDKFEKALATAPESPGIHQNFALALIEERRFDDAMPHLEAALRAMPASPDLNFHLGRLLLIRGRAAEALPALEKATVAADEPAPLAALSAAYAQLGRVDDAINTARRGLRAARDRGAEDWVRAFESQIPRMEAARPPRP